MRGNPFSNVRRPGGRGRETMSGGPDLNPNLNPYTTIPITQNRNSVIDVHETMKKEIYRQGAEGDNQSPSISLGSVPGTNPLATRPGNIAAAPKPTGFEEIELYFDSTQRDLSSDYTLGEVKWSVTTLNNAIDVKNCIEIHLNGFFFPKIYASTGQPDFFYFSRVFVEFFGETPSDQAILGPNNNKFHFEFIVENPTGQAVKLVPVKESFFFKLPLLSITNFNLRFMVPPRSSVQRNTNSFIRIPIPPDTVLVTMATTGGFGYNPIRFSIVPTSGNTNGGPADTTAIAPIGVVSPGVAIQMSDFVSNDPAVDAAVNSSAGIFVTNVIDITTFEIAGIDATTVNDIYGARMYILKNRFAFPVRFTTVKEQLTNYITVNHD